MSRRNLDREELIAAVVAAWNELPSKSKPDLMLAHPDLYGACSWLAAHESMQRRVRR